jgi:cytochrome P450
MEPVDETRASERASDPTRDSDDVKPDEVLRLASAVDHHGPALDDPFRTYRVLRKHCPVGRSDRYDGFWFVTRYEDIYRVSQDWRTFSAAQGVHVPPIDSPRPMKPIETDPPLHTRYRSIVLPFLSRANVERLEPHIRQMVSDLADGLHGDEVDASTDFARQIPLLTFAHIAGLPDEDFHRFDDWVDRIFYARTDDPAAGRRAAQELADYLEAFLRRRRSEPPVDDLVGIILGGSVNERPLTEEEQVDMCFLLFLGGVETTGWAIRSHLWYLAQHPDEAHRLADDPSAIPPAVEELLRYFPPVPGLARTVTAPVELGGGRLAPGDRVVLLYGSANHDEAEFEDPEEVDLTRDSNRHFAFGVGVHRCVGSNLARLEIRVALEEFLARFPRFSLVDPEGTAWHGIGPLRLRVERQSGTA